MPVIIFFGVINTITFITWGIDKSRAQAGKWRISERWLLTLTLLGGAFGALAGMLAFHHKIRKAYFWLLVGLACVIHALILLDLLNNL